MHYTLKFFPLDPQYRAFSSYWWAHVFNPKTYWRTVKYFCQRGYRGYADCDSWDANSYLESVMLGVITDLRDTTHSYPCADPTCDDSHGLINSEEEQLNSGYEAWKASLTEIIEGLEASKELSSESTIPDDVYGHHPLEWIDCGNGLSRMVTHDDDFNKEKYEAWAIPLRAKKKRAMLLMVKYWEAFWD